mgnify:FL=1
MIIRKIRSSLRLKLVLASVVVEIIMLGLLLSNSVRLLNIATEKYAESHLREIPLLLNAALAPLLFQRDFASIEDFLNDLIVDDHHGISYIVILDESGQLYGSGGNVNLENLPIITENIKIIADQSILNASAPLKLAGEIIGEVRFGLSLAHLIQSKKSLIFQGSLIAISEVALTIILLNIIGFMLTRHITQLVSSTKLVSKGDHSVTIQVSGIDEVGVLGKSFNEMMSAVAEKTTALRESEEQFRSTFEQAAVGLAHVAPNGKFLRINDRFCNIIGYTRKDILERTFQDITHPDDLDADLENVNQVLDNIIQTYSMEKRYFHKNGSIVWINLTVNLLRELKGKPKYFITVIEDISRRKKAEGQIAASLKEKEILLHEIHHRVKNNMQVINSLLKLQSNNIEDDKIKEILKDSQSRVYAMSAVHEILHDSEKLSEIDLKGYLSKITNSIFQTYSINHGQVKLNSDVEKSPISLNHAYPLGLIINELISNSLKYGFPEDRSGEVTVSIKKTDIEFELVVKDDGVGMPENMDWKNSESLGLKLVRTLVENQLGGSIDMESKNGTKFTIKFNIET